MRDLQGVPKTTADESRYKHPFPRHSAFAMAAFCFAYGAYIFAGRNRRPSRLTAGPVALFRVHLHRALLHRRNDHPPDHRDLPRRRRNTSSRRSATCGRAMLTVISGAFIIQSHMDRRAGHRTRRLRTGADHGVRHGGDLVDTVQPDPQKNRRRHLSRSTPRRLTCGPSRRC